MRQLTKAEFKSDNFRYRDWYQGCGGKVEIPTERAAQFFTVEDVLEGLDAVGAWVAQPKRDGIWVVAFFDDTGAQFYSRTCERKPYSLDKLNMPAFHGCALVGELGFGSQESIKRRQELGFDFMDVYDVVCFDYRECTDLDDETRRGVVNTVLNRSWEMGDNATKHFINTPTWHHSFKARYAMEPEGLILKPRYKGFPYTPGVKAKHWMKAKKDHTVDMVIMGWKQSEAETKVNEAHVEYIVCGMYVNGELKELVHVGSMTRELSHDIAVNYGSKYHNHVVELKHFGQFRSGALRHPSVVRVRDDKRAEDCIFDPEAVSPKNFKCVTLGDQDADTVE